ncbi:TPA: hypothetical protein U1C23_002279 [Streptococcus suis]|nr:hypothetical protein [Streptococcus suis]
MVDKNEYEQLKKEWLKEEKERRYEEQRETFEKLFVFISCLFSIILFGSGVMLGDSFLKDGGVFTLQLTLFFFLYDYILS